MNWWKPILVTVLLFLSSCSALSPAADAVRSAVLDRGAAVADRALENAELVMCRIGTAGSVERRYGATAELAAARRVIRKQDPDYELFGPHGGS